MSILYEHHANILDHGLTEKKNIQAQTLPVHVNILIIPQIVFVLVYIYSRSVCCVFAE